MAGEWTTSRLEDLSTNFDGKRRPVKGSERRSGPYPYYGASGVVDHVDAYLFDGEYLLVAEDGENLRTRQTPIAFMARGKFWVNNHAHIITGNEKADTRFLMYSLRHVDIGAYLTGAVMPKLTQGNLNRIEIYHPPLLEQRAIAGVLGALDDKIEQNRRTARVLEQLARAVFRAWFVEFEPVNAKAAGATSFPSMPQQVFDALPTCFIDSSIGPVPEGWQVMALSSAFDVNPPRLLRKGDSAPYLDMKNMPTEGHAPDEWVERPFGSGMRFMNGDTLVARITPCLENGKTAFVDFLNEGQIAWGSTEYIVLRPKPPLPPVFAYCLARTEEFRDFAIQNMTGTSGRQRVASNALDHFCLAMPSQETAVAFGEILQPVFDCIRAAGNESRKLAQLRDYLLPKLLSGDVLVGNGTGRGGLP
jgi:type I restriction enzyme S subunit